MAIYKVPVRPDEIYHHGILGQKWGIRRYQDYDGTLTSAGRKHKAKDYQKELNSTDRKMAYNTRYANDARKKYVSYDRKIDDRKKKLESDGKTYGNDKKIEKWSNASKEQKAIYKSELSKYSKGEKKCKEILKKASSEGYTVSSQKVSRSAATGKDVAKAIAVDALLGAYGHDVFLSPNYMVDGTKYSVKDDYTDGLRTRYDVYTDYAPYYYYKRGTI